MFCHETFISKLAKCAADCFVFMVGVSLAVPFVVIILSPFVAGW